MYFKYWTNWKEKCNSSFQVLNFLFLLIFGNWIIIFCSNSWKSSVELQNLLSLLHTICDSWKFIKIGKDIYCYKSYSEKYVIAFSWVMIINCIKFVSSCSYIVSYEHKLHPTYMNPNCNYCHKAQWNLITSLWYVI